MKRLKPVTLKTVVVGRHGKKDVRVPVKVDCSKAPSASSSSKNDRLQVEAEQNSPIPEAGQLDSSPSEYSRRMINSSLNWEKVRGSLLDASIGFEELPEDEICAECEEAATIRCRYCGCDQFFCLSCAKDIHSKRNKFHVLEEWKVSIALLN